jgi:hypothetical protein
VSVGFRPLQVLRTGWRTRTFLSAKSHLPTDPAQKCESPRRNCPRRSTTEAELLAVAALETIKAEAIASKQDVRPYQSGYLALKQAELDLSSI